MSTWLAVLVAAAAFTLTYVFCVRPMMRGRGNGEDVAVAAVDPEIAELREELRALRAQDSSRRQPPEG
ncbi:hypothetical protein [Mycolicibacterium moriokaense]|uniref:Uncharacterized protein n=1 Tax=Mycolicibacterium moriokaense TaxID=39691 RepID=A0A318HD00_9MYCO|nr:hypothetical protein [Mycolicibacterium moriokaense]PXX06254.1 hypothetical protein C8E89_11427 [Mycolicibacterium moriokaense]